MDLENSPECFHTPVTCTFLRTEGLRQFGLRFDTRIRPHFEDTHFTIRYLLATGTRVGLVADAVYLYRPRHDRSSLTQGKQLDPRTFTDVPRLGYLDCLTRSRELLGRVPEWLQNMILYSMTWQFGSAENNEPTCARGEVGAAYLRALREVRTFLDDHVIDGFPARQLSRQAREALLRLNDANWHSSYVVIDRVDPEAKQRRLVYLFKGEQPSETVLSRDRAFAVQYAKTQPVVYFGQELMTKRILWVPTDDPLEVLLDTDPIAVKEDWPGSPAPDGSPKVRMREFATRAARGTIGLASRYPHRYADAWLLMDRAHTANDNAEWLFRHLRQERPDINAWFVVARGTPSWDRLVRDHLDDHIVAYGSTEWKLLVLACSRTVSSQLDGRHITPPDVTRWRKRPGRYAYLRHGVSQSDQSSWLNPAPIDLLVTSTIDEHRAIVADGSPYVFTEKEVKLSGMPRFDRLRELGRSVVDADRDLILIAPTWRESLSAYSALGPMRNDVTEGFVSSTYARTWLQFLNSSELAAIAAERGLHVGFLPHPHVQAALPGLALADHIEVLRYDRDDVQELFARTALLVTDYSSVAFDAAYIDRPVLYYQFDRDEFLSGNSHPGRAGYFDHRRDGFGPVADTLADVLAAVAELAGFPMPEVYRERVERTFPNRDGRCCARVTAAIEAL